MGATVKAPPDPLEQEIEKVQAAIIQVKDSEDPVYMAAPWKRRDLIEQLTERIANLRQVQAEKAQAAAERARRQQLQQAWVDLGPKRQAFAQRWEALRAQYRELLADAKALNAEHVSTADRRAFSELLADHSLHLCRLEVLEVADGFGPVLVRPSAL